MGQLTRNRPLRSSLRSLRPLFVSITQIISKQIASPFCFVAILRVTTQYNPWLYLLFSAYFFLSAYGHHTIYV